MTTHKFAWLNAQTVGYVQVHNAAYAAIGWNKAIILGGQMAIVTFSRKLIQLAATSAVLIPVGAQAQTMDSALQEPLPVLPSDFPNDRTSVAERYRPDYEAEGIAIGGLNAHPSLGVGGAYSSNVYGSASGEISDAYLAINPSLVIEGNGGGPGTNNITIRADGALRRFAQEQTANETAFGGDVDGTLALGGDSALMAGASARRKYERQDSGSFPTGALAPIAYSDISGYLRFRTGGSRIRVSAAVDVDRNKYNNAKFSNGTTTDQSFRDRTILRGSGRVESSFTGAVSGFVEVRYSDINYLDNFLANGLGNRDGDQAEAYGGLRIDSGKLRGTIAAGYTRRTFDEADYPDFGGLAVNAEVIYYASGLTTYTLHAYRNITESGNADISAQFGTGVSLQVDHELLRYVILSGRAEYQRNTFRGISRKDDVASVRASVRYLVNRRLEIGANAGYVKRTSSGSLFGPEFNRFEAGLSIVGKL